MKIAYTIGPGRGDTDLLLAGVADALMNKGLRVCGTVQTNSERECEGPCDMDVQILPDGPVVRISQSLGKESKGCRLDPEALELSVAHVGTSLDQGADVLIVNKFGKHEADGRGFREVIARALSEDIPVIVGANRMNLEAFQEFTGGIAVEVAPENSALLAWLEDAQKGEAA